MYINEKSIWDENFESAKVRKLKILSLMRKFENFLSLMRKLIEFEKLKISSLMRKLIEFVFSSILIDFVVNMKIRKLVEFEKSKISSIVRKSNF